MTPATYNAILAVREVMIRRHIRDEAEITDRLRAAGPIMLAKREVVV